MSRKLTRRTLLQATAVGPLVLNLSACATDEPVYVPFSGVATEDEVVFGLYNRSALATGEEVVAAACKHLDFSWLGNGDSVLVKLACNSGNEHPAVTSPAAIRGLVAQLFERGAGRVIVGDQSGVEAVRLVEGDKRVSSTQELMEGNALLAAIKASGAETHLFDDHGYDAGYFEATPPTGHHWTRPMMIPNIVKQVDHIVLLPRLSSHVLAGYTHGFKISVGWLRDDSRHHLHHDFVSFYEKYTEVNYCEEIRERSRLVFTLAESVLLHYGPDDGTELVADPRIVIASQNLAHHEVLSAGVLAYLNTTLESESILAYDSEKADVVNQFFVNTVVPTKTGLPWGESETAEYTSLEAHEYANKASLDGPLQRAWEILGGAPETVRALMVSAQPDPALQAACEKRSEGLLTFA